MDAAMPCVLSLQRDPADAALHGTASTAPRGGGDDRGTTLCSSRRDKTKRLRELRPGWKGLMGL